MLTYAEAAERLGVSTNAVKTMIAEHKLLAIRSDEGLVVPAEVLDGDVPVKHLMGVLTLLHDAGYSAEEAWTWLTTADDSLPGTPLQALHENRATEVKRRAQALGF